MPTKRNNKFKEFDIGTKIEKDGRLYEVVKCEYCENCSISSFCSASDDYVPSLLIDRDKLLSIFGECSAINRSDGTSVIFKEVPMNKSDNINHNIIQPLVESDGTIKDLQIKAPYNYEIDMENSDLSKGIIKFKHKWLTIEEMYNLKPIVACEYISPSIAVNVSTRKKIVAISNLMDIARYFNGDWNYSTKCNDMGYSIAYDDSTKEPCYLTRTENPNTDIYYGNVVFKNKADAQYVIDNPNFRDILDKIFKV